MDLYQQMKYSYYIPINHICTFSKIQKRISILGLLLQLCQENKIYFKS